ncbi:MAG: hypothetical protein GXO89_02555 [Chlorobi bacterium]|nr:hypothetical protein [Chlorobiota bacterium]
MKIDVIRAILLAILPFWVSAQDGFEFIIEDTLSIKCFSTFIDDTGNYISLGLSGNPSNYTYDAMILQFKSPDDLKIEKYQKTDTSYSFWFGFVLESGNYFVVGTIDDNDDIYRKNLYVAEINPDLEIVKENIYGIPPTYNSLSLADLYVDSDSIVVISGMVDDPAPGWVRDLYVAKLNVNGELLDTTISSYYDNDSFGEILRKQDGSGYYLIGGCSFAELIELDNNINITGSQPIDPNNIYQGAIGARWLASGNIIIASLANQEVPGAFYDLRVRVSNTELDALKDTVIIDNGKNFLPMLSGLDFTDENNIWVATYPQMGKSNADWEYGRIYLFDNNLNVKGAKYFGGTLSLYLYSLKALEDGGCIITGIAADDKVKGYTDVFIKKVMPDDILTHAEETPEPADRDVLLYPVPLANT